MSDEAVEYECSECKASVGKYDTVCPKCGASLEEIIKEDAVSKPDYLRPSRLTIGESGVGVGLLWLIGGIVVTAVTYSAAGQGGRYFVAWGAMLYGLIRIFRGFFGNTKNSRPSAPTELRPATRPPEYHCMTCGEVVPSNNSLCEKCSRSLVS